MNYHIVRNGETIEKIAIIYNLDVVEIKEVNPHIRTFENLVPGLKLRLPEIPESVAVEINDVEPFIEDYYPTLTNYEDKNFASEKTEKVTEEEKPEIQTDSKKQPQTYINYSKPKPVYYNPYIYPYFYYPYYNMNRRRTK